MPEILITNYTELLAAVPDWLNRGDLVDHVPAFVTLGEAQLNRDLRVRDMMVRATTTSDAENVELPADYLEHYSLSLATGQPGLPLRYMSERESNEVKAAGATGTVVGYTLIGNAFELVPAPGGNVDLRLVYYARIPALKNAIEGKNWLLTKAPDLYLYATLLQSAPFLKDDDRMAAWGQIAGGLIGSLNQESEAALRPRSGFVARARW